MIGGEKAIFDQVNEIHRHLDDGVTAPDLALSAAYLRVFLENEMPAHWRDAIEGVLLRIEGKASVLQ